jgi:hypothetical protein
MQHIRRRDEHFAAGGTALQGPEFDQKLHRFQNGNIRAVHAFSMIVLVAG